jgi:hypothetical protein
MSAARHRYIGELSREAPRTLRFFDRSALSEREWRANVHLMRTGLRSVGETQRNSDVA